MYQILVFSLILNVILCKNVCYDQLGCFTDSYPFSATLQRPIALLPEIPEKISTKFYLFNRNVPLNESERISHFFFGDNLNPDIDTKFIIHGFLHHPRKQWILNMKDTILNAEDVNVIIVDWSKGNAFPYHQASANAQVVGAEIARLITNIIREKNSRPSKFHLIGHSLGAHVAGYAGSRITGLGRITGLDPAGPLFENTDPIVRLDPSDAVYVDIIHSDGTANLLLGLGLSQPIGHSDFYPNGGKNQPNCPANSDKLLSGIFNIAILDYEGMEESLGCSHMAAVNFFIDSILNKCKYTAFKCKSLEDFENAKCLSCSDKGCNRMGYWSEKDKDSGSLFLKTQSLQKETFCQEHYLIRLESNSKSITGLVQARGKFTIYFESDSERSSIEILDDSQTTFKQESIEDKIISLNKTFSSRIDSIYLNYSKTTNLLSSWLYENSWSFKSIEILNGDNQIITKYCPQDLFITDKKTTKFFRC
ncbi:unnamed protein product [Brachionus calyciflorus]|uniref:Lipase domain-containing protein n=1 Tax=Brachionus calyciflorus TaxID=104777 RepID=A0A814GU17_9BILA|nr:unnamed protein product [Brachionus calyciflorus]